ncbi:MAG: hypothetical protein GY884_23375, partial [Proteobacteria bacterium]|nr:hypothetical protein [Pseudomonadota bacterium]
GEGWRFLVHHAVPGTTWVLDVDDDLTSWDLLAELSPTDDADDDFRATFIDDAARFGSSEELGVSHEVTWTVDAR